MAAREPRFIAVGPIRNSLALLAAAAAAGTATVAAAQTYPSRPITLVVPFPSGAKAE